MKFRKKPVIVDAIKWDGVNWNEVTDFLKGAKFHREYKDKSNQSKDMQIWITTLEGEMRADTGDWIIKGIKGEFYPCKNDVFEATYELVKEA